MAVTVKKKTRLSREDWLARAMKVLSRQGGANLTIDYLCEAVGVTKGSFYWHFKDRADFVQALARYWEQWSTDSAVQEIGDGHKDPKAVLLKLHEIVTRSDLARYDLVMRSWATHESEVAQVVRSVDRKRFRFVGEQFRRLGYRGDDLDIRTRAFVVSSSFWSVINRGESRRQRRRRLAALLDIFTGS